MKNLFIFSLLILAIISCNNNDSPIEQIIDNNPDIIELNPRVTGLLQGCLITEFAEELPNNTQIAASFPTIFDLSHLMPPVLNQGNQKSDVAFATTYYLKSYQEKIQHNYEYLGTNEVMSPAFVYNQTKASTNCNQGTCIENALHVLKTQGVSTWSDFNYNETSCTQILDAENTTDALLIIAAQTNKIESYHNVQNHNLSADLLTILKSLLLQGNPIILGIKVDSNFKNAIPRLEDSDNDDTNDLYIYNQCDTVNNDKHAVLIVGYNDVNNTFKVVNSWGDDWANEGYGLVSYNFFIEDTDPNFQEGLLELFIAFDAL